MAISLLECQDAFICDDCCRCKMVDLIYKRVIGSDLKQVSWNFSRDTCQTFRCAYHKPDELCMERRLRHRIIEWTWVRCKLVTGTLRDNYRLEVASVLSNQSFGPQTQTYLTELNPARLN